MERGTLNSGSFFKGEGSGWTLQSEGRVREELLLQTGAIVFRGRGGQYLVNKKVCRDDGI